MGVRVRVKCIVLVPGPKGVTATFGAVQGASLSDAAPSLSAGLFQVRGKPGMRFVQGEEYYVDFSTIEEGDTL